MSSGPKHPVEFFEGPVLVGNVFKYFIHEDAVERSVWERQASVGGNAEGNVRMRPLGCFDSVGCDVYSARCRCARLKQSIRIAAVGATVIKPITSTDIICDPSHTILHVERKGGRAARFDLHCSAHIPDKRHPHTPPLRGHAKPGRSDWVLCTRRHMCSLSSSRRRLANRPVSVDPSPIAAAPRPHI